VAEAVVVGGGVGGMATAIRLAHASHHVVLLERNDVLGGKLARHQAAGYTWETGPSLLTLPAVFDELLGLVGSKLPDPVRLDPSFRYHFADGSSFCTRDDPEATEAEVERLSPGSGIEWRRFMAGAARVWSVAERTFFAGPLENPWQLARRLRSPLDLSAVDPLPTLHTRARRAFADPRLVQWADRYATYAGSSPFEAPATLGCIPHIEQAHGAWYLQGGLGRLADVLAGACTAAGVDIRTGVGVEAVEADSDRVSGVRLAGGERVGADVVVADVDAAHLYGDLLPDRASLRRVRQAGRSSSGFVLLLGVRGRTDGLGHHTVSFSADYEAEFGAIHQRGMASDDPTVYVCSSSVTDPSAAPPGCENWFVLVNVPSFDDELGDSGEARGDGLGPWADGGAAYGDHVLAVLARRGFDLGGRIEHREAITPADIAHRYRSVGGAIYGTSSNGRRAAFARPPNRGPRRGLYLVGGSTHPGGGLPLVAISARIVAAMVEADLGAAAGGAGSGRRRHRRR
jgi:phytoene desaturase